MDKPINCIIVDDEAVAREIIAAHLAQLAGIHIVGQCSNALEAFNIISKEVVDLIFLDINMPEISGIAFAKSINKNIKVIFTTAYREYAVDGFDLEAVDYLLKPISYERLVQAVNRYRKSNTAIHIEPVVSELKPDFIFVRADRQMQKVDFEDISYIESYSDYIKINVSGKTIVTRETISSIEAKLPRSQFLRIHRSYIVALKHISAFTHEHVVIDNKTFTISRSYKSHVLKSLERF